MENKADFLMDDHQLANLGEKTARAFLPVGTVKGKKIRRCVKAQLSVLDSCRSRLEKDIQPSQPAQWLLDNWYLAQREAIESAASFRCAGRLRAVKDKKGFQPYIIELSKVIVGALVSDFTANRLEIILTHGQNARSFTEQELSLLIPSLKLALVERIIALCPEIEALRADSDPEEEVRLAKSMENIFRAFRFLISADFTALLEGASGIETALLRDPSGVYPQMDEDTRRRYRQAVCKLAREHSMSEQETAERILSLAVQSNGDARHVGWFIFRAPLGQRIKPRSGAAYLSIIILSVLAISLFIGFSLGSTGATLLLFFSCV